MSPWWYYSIKLVNVSSFSFITVKDKKQDRDKNALYKEKISKSYVGVRSAYNIGHHINNVHSITSQPFLPHLCITKQKRWARNKEYYEACVSQCVQMLFIVTKGKLQKISIKLFHLRELYGRQDIVCVCGLFVIQILSYLGFELHWKIRYENFKTRARKSSIDGWW